MAVAGFRVERTRGVAAGREGDVRAFWSRHAMLDAETMERRLPHVAALLVDEAGAVEGTCSVVDATVPLIGGRRFWIYRRLVTPAVPAEADATLFLTVFDDLDREHEPGSDGPIGFCAVDQPRPEAMLPGTWLQLAGYTPSGEQLRLRYFEGARIR